MSDTAALSAAAPVGQCPTAEALSAKINAVARAEADPDRQRAAVIALLRQALEDGRSAIAEDLEMRPLAARDAIRATCKLTDAVVIAAWTYVIEVRHPAPTPTASERIAVIGVGGFGRGEMAPHSDVDLLFLTPWKQTAWGESCIEAVLYILWDLRLKVGHAVRTVEDCLRLGSEDITIRTALLENRLLAGDEGLAEELTEALWAFFARTGPEFVQAKLAEREERHRRHGGSRYLVEPNVKEGKGGLRDLQTLFWIAKYLHRVDKAEDLVDQGVFTAAEMKTFREAETFLWAVRCQLHLITDRATETLTFDLQMEAAERMGFVESGGQRAVERFMQTYFTFARQVGELTRIFLVALEAEHVKPRASVRRSLMNIFSRDAQAPEGYAVLNGRLDVTDTDAFLADPVNLLRLFQTAARVGYALHPNALRLVASNLNLIDDAVRADPEANGIFLQLLLNRDDPERALRRMHEIGVLGAFIPAFGRITAMMQYNMYHHYTVDEHTIRCIRVLHELEQGQRIEEMPVASEILERGVSRRILYAALFFHDIGKGQTRDHSDVGAEIAAEVAPRLGLDPDEVDTVVWLVQNHLSMSDFAQKRDLADSRTVADFAAIVQSRARLRLLLVLTVCDICGVGPGVWNNWKAMLLRTLYRRTLDHLSGEPDRQSRPERVEEAKAAFVEAVAHWGPEDVEAELDRHYASFWLGLPTPLQVTMAELSQNLTTERPALRMDPDEDRDATRACIAMADHPGVFSRIAGALALAGANVKDARSYTSSDGITGFVFWIQDNDGQPFDETRLPRLSRMIERTLSGEVVARDAFAERDRLKKRERGFTVPTEITFDNEGSEIYTMITVDTRDRPGLLYDLTRSLTQTHVRISSAIIATYGEQAVDTFYVKDSFGLKVSTQSKQQQIAQRLRNAIQEGAARAAP